jgi:uncharacterized damage-inducible protein DinB
MLKDYFIHQFKYNNWATNEAAKSLKGLEKKDERLEELLSHIISAQQIWLNRILERKINVGPWEKHSVQECIPKSTTITAEWINLLESLIEKEFERRIDYVNTKGEKFNNSIKDIVSHVLNHSTYHRAQIAQKVKALGGKPSVTDYIFYQRQFQR